MPPAITRKGRLHVDGHTLRRFFFPFASSFGSSSSSSEASSPGAGPGDRALLGAPNETRLAGRAEKGSRDGVESVWYSTGFWATTGG